MPFYQLIFLGHLALGLVLVPLFLLFAVAMLDCDGNRVDRRNPQDIFTPLYNHQIPPGVAAVVHYNFAVPLDAVEPLGLEVKLQYRKFDTIYSG